MKINLTNMGGKVAARAPQSDVPSAAFVTGDPYQQLRQDLNQVAERKEAERRHRESELRRARGIESYAGFQADVDDLSDDISKRLSRGEVKRDEVEDLYTKGLGERRTARLAGLDNEQQQLIGSQLGTVERRGRLVLRRAMDEDLKREGLATLANVEEEYSRIGVREPQRAIDQHGRAIDDQAWLLGDDQAAKRKHAFAEHAFYTHFATRIGESRENADALKAIEGEVAGNERLDPDRKNKLLADIGRFQAKIAHDGEVA